MADREKVIKGLECCSDTEYDCALQNDCPYSRNYGEECMLEMKKDALELLKDGDRVKVVRCADCRYWEPENAEEGDYSGHCKRSFGICYGQVTDASWFCADGEREE